MAKFSTHSAAAVVPAIVVAAAKGTTVALSRRPAWRRRAVKGFSRNLAKAQQLLRLLWSHRGGPATKRCGAFVL